MQGLAYNVIYNQATGSINTVMTNRQIQPVRNRDLQIIRQARPRSLWGQVWTVALQPNNFFLALPQVPSSSRQWFWVALLILALNGFSAVRQEALSSGVGGGDSNPVTQIPGDLSGAPGGSFSGKPGSFPAQPGLPSAGPDLSTGAPTDLGGAPSDISSTWVTALISATTILVGWFILAVILCEVPLFNGVRPSFGQNLQIAIWTTVPLGIMAGLQVIYFAAGGKVGTSGIAGLLDYWKAYNDFSPLVRNILLSLTSRLTVFWIWTLVLIYIGGRTALNGKAWAVAVVVVVWVLILVLVPVLTGAISAPVVVNNTIPDPITLPENGGILPEATLSEGETLPTIEATNSDESSTPEGNSVISTPEGNSTSPTIEGNFSISTVQPVDDGSSPTIEPEQVTATPS